MNGARVRGFSLIEVLAALALIGAGLTAGLAATASITRGENRLRESELMNRLATEKLEELVAAGNLTSAETSGNFEEYGQPGYDWSLEVQPSGVENLDTVVVEVTRVRESASAPRARAETLVFVPPTQGATP